MIKTTQGENIIPEGHKNKEMRLSKTYLKQINASQIFGKVIMSNENSSPSEYELECFYDLSFDPPQIHGVIEPSFSLRILDSNEYYIVISLDILSTSSLQDSTSELRYTLKTDTGYVRYILSSLVYQREFPLQLNIENSNSCRHNENHNVCV